MSIQSEGSRLTDVRHHLIDYRDKCELCGVVIDGVTDGPVTTTWIEHTVLVCTDACYDRNMTSVYQGE